MGQPAQRFQRGERVARRSSEQGVGDALILGEAADGVAFEVKADVAIESLQLAAHRRIFRGMDERRDER